MSTPIEQKIVSLTHAAEIAVEHGWHDLATAIRSLIHHMTGGKNVVPPSVAAPQPMNLHSADPVPITQTTLTPKA